MKRDLFRSTAPFYARFRPADPDAPFEGIASFFTLDDTGTALDPGCGPGRLTLPLSRYFEGLLWRNG